MEIKYEILGAIEDYIREKYRDPDTLRVNPDFLPQLRKSIKYPDMHEFHDETPKVKVLGLLMEIDPQVDRFSVE